MTVGFVTLEVGQKALVYNHVGEGRIETGPQRLLLFRERIVWLTAFTARQSEYLRVQHRDGHISHIRGPQTLFLNPLEHMDIQVKAGKALDANELLVVYRRDALGNITRYLKEGPTVYYPTADEWLHEFTWHGTDPSNKTQQVAGRRQFTTLQVSPDQIYYNVDDVRTADDARVRVKLMLFYELRDIERMLSSTQDPIADFINCLEADVMAFAAKLSYLEFMDRSHQLNDLASYPQLQERCKQIGYGVNKVVFRGYHASPTLQAMHDEAIRAHTQLKIAFEKEEQEQELTDSNLQNEAKRAAQEQSLELEALEHELKLEKSSVEHELSLRATESGASRQLSAASHSRQLQAAKDRRLAQLRHLAKLADLGVDVAPYVLNQQPAIPASVTRVVGSAGNLHLYHNTGVKVEV